jgi:hypothetical protein
MGITEEHHLYRRAELPPFSCIKANRNSNRILACRVLFLSFLCGAAARLTWLTRFSRSLRTAWLEIHFDRLRIDRALDTVLKLPANVWARYLWPPLLHQFPDAESWPFDHERIRNNLSNLIENIVGSRNGLCPFVTEQLPMFEESSPMTTMKSNFP